MFFEIVFKFINKNEIIKINLIWVWNEYNSYLISKSLKPNDPKFVPKPIKGWFSSTFLGII